MNLQEERQSSFAFVAEQSSALHRSDPGNSHPTRLTEWTPERWAVAEDWRPVLDQFLAGEAAQKLGFFMRERLQSGAIIYPAQPFRALALTPLAQVKVVILGQDPYHQPGQAEGLAFSVAPGVKPPPSLRNIFKEIARAPLLEGEKSRESRDGSLVRWASQGVLLLNTCLTVEEGQPASHAQRGWEVLTDAIVKVVSHQQHPTAFLLWGAHAQAKQNLIVASDVRSGGGRPVKQVLTANHPSPLSALRPPRPFIGCGHFELVNEFLKQHESAPIAW